MKTRLDPGHPDYRGHRLVAPADQEREVMRLHAAGVGPLSIAVRVGLDHAHVLRVLARRGDEAAKAAAREHLGPKASNVGRVRRA